MFYGFGEADQDMDAATLTLKHAENLKQAYLREKDEALAYKRENERLQVLLEQRNAALDHKSKATSLLVSMVSETQHPINLITNLENFVKEDLDAEISIACYLRSESGWFYLGFDKQLTEVEDGSRWDDVSAALVGCGMVSLNEVYGMHPYLHTDIPEDMAESDVQLFSIRREFIWVFVNQSETFQMLHIPVDLSILETAAKCILLALNKYVVEEIRELNTLYSSLSETLYSHLYNSKPDTKLYTLWASVPSVVETFLTGITCDVYCVSQEISSSSSSSSGGRVSCISSNLSITHLDSASRSYVSSAATRKQTMWRDADDGTFVGCHIGIDCDDDRNIHAVVAMPLIDDSIKMSPVHCGIVFRFQKEPPSVQDVAFLEGIAKHIAPVLLGWLQATNHDMFSAKLASDDEIVSKEKLLVDSQSLLSVSQAVAEDGFMQALMDSPSALLFLKDHFQLDWLVAIGVGQDVFHNDDSNAGMMRRRGDQRSDLTLIDNSGRIRQVSVGEFGGAAKNCIEEAINAVLDESSADSAVNLVDVHSSFDLCKTKLSYFLESGQRWAVNLSKLPASLCQSVVIRVSTASTQMQHSSHDGSAVLLGGLVCRPPLQLQHISQKVEELDDMFLFSRQHRDLKRIVDVAEGLGGYLHELEGRRKYDELLTTLLQDLDDLREFTNLGDFSANMFRQKFVNAVEMAVASLLTSLRVSAEDEKYKGNIDSTCARVWASESIGEAGVSSVWELSPEGAWVKLSNSAKVERSLEIKKLRGRFTLYEESAPDWMQQQLDMTNASAAENFLQLTVYLDILDTGDFDEQIDFSVTPQLKNTHAMVVSSITDFVAQYKHLMFITAPKLEANDMNYTLNDALDAVDFGLISGKQQLDGYIDRNIVDIVASFSPYFHVLPLHVDEEAGGALVRTESYHPEEYVDSVLEATGESKGEQAQPRPLPLRVQRAIIALMKHIDTSLVYTTQGALFSLGDFDGSLYNYIVDDDDNVNISSTGAVYLFVSATPSFRTVNAFICRDDVMLSPSIVSHFAAYMDKVTRVISVAVDAYKSDHFRAFIARGATQILELSAHTSFEEKKDDHSEEVSKEMKASRPTSPYRSPANSRPSSPRPLTPRRNNLPLSPLRTPRERSASAGSDVSKPTKLVRILGDNSAFSSSWHVISKVSKKWADLSRDLVAQIDRTPCYTSVFAINGESLEFDMVGKSTNNVDSMRTTPFTARDLKRMIIEQCTHVKQRAKYFLDVENITSEIVPLSSTSKDESMKTVDQTDKDAVILLCTEGDMATFKAKATPYASDRLGDGNRFISIAICVQSWALKGMDTSETLLPIGAVFIEAKPGALMKNIDNDSSYAAAVSVQTREALLTYARAAGSVVSTAFNSGLQSIKMSEKFQLLVNSSRADVTQLSGALTEILSNARGALSDANETGYPENDISRLCELTHEAMTELTDQYRAAKYLVEGDPSNQVSHVIEVQDQRLQMFRAFLDSLERLVTEKNTSANLPRLDQLFAESSASQRTLEHILVRVGMQRLVTRKLIELSCELGIHENVTSLVREINQKACSNFESTQSRLSTIADSDSSFEGLERFLTGLYMQCETNDHDYDRHSSTNTDSVEDFVVTWCLSRKVDGKSKESDEAQAKTTAFANPVDLPVKGLRSRDMLATVLATRTPVVVESQSTLQLTPILPTAADRSIVPTVAAVIQYMTPRVADKLMEGVLPGSHCFDQTSMRMEAQNNFETTVYLLADYMYSTRGKRSEEMNQLQYSLLNLNQRSERNVKLANFMKQMTSLSYWGILVELVAALDGQNHLSSLNDATMTTTLLDNFFSTDKEDLFMRVGYAVAGILRCKAVFLKPFDDGAVPLIAGGRSPLKNAHMRGDLWAGEAFHWNKGYIGWGSDTVTLSRSDLNTMSTLPTLRSSLLSETKGSEMYTMCGAFEQDGEFHSAGHMFSSNSFVLLVESSDRLGESAETVFTTLCNIITLALTTRNSRSGVDAAVIMKDRLKAELRLEKIRRRQLEFGQSLFHELETCSRKALTSGTSDQKGAGEMLVDLSGDVKELLALRLQQQVALEMEKLAPLVNATSLDLQSATRQRVKTFSTRHRQRFNIDDEISALTSDEDFGALCIATNTVVLVDRKPDTFSKKKSKLSGAGKDSSIDKAVVGCAFVPVYGLEFYQVNTSQGTADDSLRGRSRSRSPSKKPSGDYVEVLHEIPEVCYFLRIIFSDATEWKDFCDSESKKSSSLSASHDSALAAPNGATVTARDVINTVSKMIRRCMRLHATIKSFVTHSNNVAKSMTIFSDVVSKVKDISEKIAAKEINGAEMLSRHVASVFSNAVGDSEVDDDYDDVDASDAISNVRLHLQTSPSEGYASNGVAGKIWYFADVNEVAKEYKDRDVTGEIIMGVRGRHRNRQKPLRNARSALEALLHENHYHGGFGSVSGRQVEASEADLVDDPSNPETIMNKASYVEETMATMIPERLASILASRSGIVLLFQKVRATSSTYKPTKRHSRVSFDAGDDDDDDSAHDELYLKKVYLRVNDSESAPSAVFEVAFKRGTFNATTEDLLAAGFRNISCEYEDSSIRLFEKQVLPSDSTNTSAMLHVSKSPLQVTFFQVEYKLMEALQMTFASLVNPVTVLQEAKESTIASECVLWVSEKYSTALRDCVSLISSSGWSSNDAVEQLCREMEIMLTKIPAFKKFVLCITKNESADHPDSDYEVIYETQNASKSVGADSSSRTQQKLFGAHPGSAIKMETPKMVRVAPFMASPAGKSNPPKYAEEDVTADPRCSVFCDGVTVELSYVEFTDEELGDCLFEQLQKEHLESGEKDGADWRNRQQRVWLITKTLRAEECNAVLQEMLQSLALALARRIASMTHEMAGKQQVSELNAVISAQRNTISAKEASRADLLSALDATKADLQTTQDDLRNTQDDLQNTQDDYEASQEKLSDTQVDLTSLTTAIARFEERFPVCIAMLQMTNLDENVDVATLNNDAGKGYSDIEIKIRQELEGALKLEKDTGDGLRVALEALLDYKQRRASGRLIHGDPNSDIETLIDNMSTAEHSYAHARGRVQSLRHELSALQKTIAEASDSAKPEFDDPNAQLSKDFTSQLNIASTDAETYHRGTLESAVKAEKDYGDAGDAEYGTLKKESIVEVVAAEVTVTEAGEGGGLKLLKKPSLMSAMKIASKSSKTGTPKSPRSSVSSSPRSPRLSSLTIPSKPAVPKLNLGGKPTEVIPPADYWRNPSALVPPASPPASPSSKKLSPRAAKSGSKSPTSARSVRSATSPRSIQSSKSAASTAMKSPRSVSKSTAKAASLLSAGIPTSGPKSKPLSKSSAGSSKASSTAAAAQLFSLFPSSVGASASLSSPRKLSAASSVSASGKSSKKTSPPKSKLAAGSTISSARKISSAASTAPTSALSPRSARSQSRSPLSARSASSKSPISSLLGFTAPSKSITSSVLSGTKARLSSASSVGSGKSTSSKLSASPITSPRYKTMSTSNLPTSKVKSATAISKSSQPSKSPAGGGGISSPRSPRASASPRRESKSVSPRSRRVSSLTDSSVSTSGRVSLKGATPTFSITSPRKKS
jgi:hypothetical protein